MGPTEGAWSAWMAERRTGSRLLPASIDASSHSLLLVGDDASWLSRLGDETTKSFGNVCHHPLVCCKSKRD
ncbi:Os05g0138100 [Oryza sativa Japonica Group]|uniref:Os05g0138100 protein n=1 Tax=Oryza sativa subsp. japonica TaxID=39947 RepID=A0A0P0WHP3_ORYSJ|nr:Os05g0138100 [Oryza sativa Japonica Group]